MLIIDCSNMPSASLTIFTGRGLAVLPKNDPIGTR